MAHERTQHKLPALNVISKLALTRTSSGTLYRSGSCVTNFTDTCVSSESIVGCDASNERKRDVLKTESVTFGRHGERYACLNTLGSAGKDGSAGKNAAAAAADARH